MPTPDPLWGLLYESTASRPMTRADLEDILAVARERNEENGLTGWLTYAPGPEGGPGVFTQYIEGPRSAVRALFYGDGKRGGIERDSRHREIRLIQEGAFGGGPPGARLYPGWRMEWVDAPHPLGG